MGRFVVGEVVVLPFPQTNLVAGKRRPALVVASAGGADLILCQITSQSHARPFTVSLRSGDFVRGALSVDSSIRTNRLFTVEESVILYSAASISAAKLEEVKVQLRQLLK